MWLQKCTAIQRSYSAPVISLEQILQEIDSQILHFAAAKIPAAPVCQHGVVGRGCRMSWEGTVCSWKGRTAACSGLAALSLLCIPVQISSGSQESCLALWVGGSEARPCVVLLTASSVWIGTLKASSPITPGSNSCAYGKQRINPLPEERTW